MHSLSPLMLGKGMGIYVCIITHMNIYKDVIFTTIRAESSIDKIKDYGKCQQKLKQNIEQI